MSWFVSVCALETCWQGSSSDEERAGEDDCDGDEDECNREHAEQPHEAKRWSVMESSLEGSLQEWVTRAARQEHTEPYLRVAELLRQRGVISLSNEAWPAFEASPDRPPCHPSRFIEKLLRKVPAIVAFSSSRKDGWLLAARAGGGMYDALAAAYRLARGLEERELQAEALTEEELTALEAVLEPSDVRYVLCQVFGVQGTSERFGFGTNSLHRIEDKVSAVLEQHGGQADASSPQKRRNRRRRGRRSRTNSEEGASAGRRRTRRPPGCWSTW